MSNPFMEMLDDKFGRELQEEVEKGVKRELQKREKDIERELQKRKNDIEKEFEKEFEKREKDIEKEFEKEFEKREKSFIEKAKLTELIRLILKKYSKSKPLSTIADELETEPEEILSIYNTIVKNPQKTVEEIYELLAS